MSTIHLVPNDIRENYIVHEWRNATGVLTTACGNEWSDVLTVLRAFELTRSDILTAGGRKSPIAEKIDGRFYGLGWEEKKFDTKIEVDGHEYESPTHSVDCFKGRVGVEVEWNNKDPFYDRDLNNFRLLFDLRALSVGVIVTRSDALQRIFRTLGRGSSYGESTTHMSKLLPRIEGGGGAGCPLLVFGITEALYVEGRGDEQRE